MLPIRWIRLNGIRVTGVSGINDGGGVRVGLENGVEVSVVAILVFPFKGVDLVGITENISYLSSGTLVSALATEALTFHNTNTR
jgi:hypothetical protein